MTRKEAVLLASRALALYLLCWGLSDLAYLPQYLLSVGHHDIALIGRAYWPTYYALGFSLNALKVIVLFAVARWLYRCGPRVQALFLPEESTTTAES